jgi:hypothetical protein
MPYRDRDENGDLRTFELTIERSPGTDYYITTITAGHAGTDNFVYDNPFTDWEKEDVQAELEDLQYELFSIQDTPEEAGESRIRIYWFDLWFYTEYQIIVYAADENYREFLLTYNMVREEDGNFHEPLFNVEGDGIGVFGSVVADTTRLVVTR